MLQIDSKFISKASWFNMNDDWNLNVYEEDYKLVIKQRETVRIPFLHQSPQLMYRRYMIQYLKNYASNKGLSYCCLHLAVYIMDIFMDNHAILPERLHLVANVCLLISAKFEEVSTNFPKLEELNAAVNDRYALNEYKVVELVILRFFRWYFVLPTAAHYTHYFLQASLSTEDQCISRLNYKTLIYELQEHIKTFLDKVIDDVHYMQLYTPSRLAAAIISVARKKIGLCEWNEKLQQLTEYSKEQIYEPAQILTQSSQIKCSNC